MTQIKLIGSAIGNCGRLDGCEAAPHHLSNALSHNPSTVLDTDIISYSGSSHDVVAQQEFFIRVAKCAYDTLGKHHFPIFMGGDHSCAIGSWSGVATYLEEQQQELGLIWIDAHLDAHRPQTSDSGNLHGMPVAHLLGYGHSQLSSILSSNPKLNPQNLVYFGIRSFEAAEVELLKELGVKIYYQHHLNDQNFSALFLEEYQRLAQQTRNNVGISLDLDGLDPRDLVAVGTPVADGIRSSLFLSTMMQIDIKSLIGFEIAEYNPSLDQNNQSLNYIIEIIQLIISRLSAAI